MSNPSWDLLPVNQLIRILARKSGNPETHYLGWTRQQLTQKLDSQGESNPDGVIPQGVALQELRDEVTTQVDRKTIDLEKKLIEKVKDESWLEHDYMRTQFAHLRKEIVEAIASTRRTTTKVVVLDKRGETPRESDLGRQHIDFPAMMSLLNAKMNVMLVGPAGSGKTTAATIAAKALGLPFYFNGAIDSEYKLLGFIDAQGRVISPAFRRAYEHGGVYLFDELDASMPSAALSFNAALSNDMCDFPDACVCRHPDFYCIAAGNTYYGADHQYVGRSKQDGAFLDRFMCLDWHYDTELERDLGLDIWPEGTERALQWFNMVLKIREQAALKGLQIIVSPRATLGGIKLLKNGVPWSTCVRVAIRKTMKLSDWDKIGEFADEPEPPRAAPEQGHGYSEFEDGWNDRHPQVDKVDLQVPETRNEYLRIKSHGKTHKKFIQDLI